MGKGTTLGIVKELYASGVRFSSSVRPFARPIPCPVRIDGTSLGDAALIVQGIEQATLSGLLVFGPHWVRFASGLVTDASGEPTLIFRELISGKDIPWTWERTSDVSGGRFFYPPSLLILGILASATLDPQENLSRAVPSCRFCGPAGKDRTPQPFPLPSARTLTLPEQARPMLPSEFARPCHRMFFRRRARPHVSFPATAGGQGQGRTWLLWYRPCQNDTMSEEKGQGKPTFYIAKLLSLTGAEK